MPERRDRAVGIAHRDDDIPTFTDLIDAL